MQALFFKVTNDQNECGDHRAPPEGGHPVMNTCSVFVMCSYCLQKVEALMPKFRTTRDVGQECVCSPGTCHSVYHHSPQHTKQSVWQLVKYEGLSENGDSCCFPKFLGNMCLFFSGGSLRPLEPPEERPKISRQQISLGAHRLNP